MRIEWVCKESTPGVIVFFNGWGMDAGAVGHLEGGEDLVVVSDYRRVDAACLPSLEGYGRVRVVAWSMGVWAAARVLPEWGVRPERAVAVNGTGCPVDDAWGIPGRVYAVTERGMNAEGQRKFARRMFEEEEDFRRFGEHAVARPAEEVREELVMIRRQCAAPAGAYPWDRAYVSSGDLIFPVANQRAYWEAQGVPVVPLEGGHYPFYRFSAWEEILEP